MTVYVYFPKATVKTLLVKGIGEIIKLKTLTLATAEDKCAALQQQQQTSGIQLMYYLIKNAQRIIIGGRVEMYRQQRSTYYWTK